MERCNESQPSTSSSSSSMEWSEPCRPFEFHEILLATDNFNKSLVIGHGGFGEVFKGRFINGSSVILAAIKRLDSMSSQGAPEFWAEVKMLSKLRHCHLVSLFGYCNHGNEMIIVYEYMPNGTLEDHLHKLNTPISWVQRLKICIGTARGLDYLHTGTGIEFGVIHRDVKSSNILLHKGLTAKISDFGLSRIGVTNQPSTYVNTLVKGTFGYLDPHYYTTGRLTRKSDVYSFGVILLEVLCRKRAVDRSLDEEQWGLVPWAQEVIKKGKIKNIIDSGIRDQISPKCLKGFVRIAERCLHNNPKQRPTMAEVVVSLDSILTLQQKTDSLLQPSGRTIYGRMLDIFPFPFHGETLGIPSLKVFKYSDLEMITINFSRYMVIEREFYDQVFLGWVEEITFAPSTNGVGIAIAVLRYNEGLAKTVATRCGRLAHPNITRLLGYCFDQMYNYLLVFEHKNMQTRSFGHHIFGDVPETLSWEGRLIILTGVARGLDYMHSSKEQVIHGGIKTFNILLDQNLNAKLGYFGLAKFHERDHMEDATASDMDTERYLEQRDRLTGEWTVKSDIYSFGVVLFETLTGHRAWASKYGVTLVHLIKPLLDDKSEIKTIVDYRLNHKYPLEGAFECFKLATRCLAEDPKDRPSSEEVLKSLEHIHLTHKI